MKKINKKILLILGIVALIFFSGYIGYNYANQYCQDFYTKNCDSNNKILTPEQDLSNYNVSDVCQINSTIYKYCEINYLKIYSDGKRSFQCACYRL